MTDPLIPIGPLSKGHLVSRVLHEAVYYPPHAPRTETAAYRAIHKHLVVDLDLACIACGVRNSTILNPTYNKVGAKAIETHHHVVEWALTNYIDLAKFNERIVAHFRATQPHDAKYDHDFTQQEMVDWIDHDPANLWVVCDVHHRHSLVGIHAVTFPIWAPQDLLLDGIEYTPPSTP